MKSLVIAGVDPEWPRVTVTERVKLIHQKIKLAEHKLDQFLQGEGPGTVRAGIALKELRSVLLLLEEIKQDQERVH